MQIPLSAKIYSEALINLAQDNVLGYEQINNNLDIISQILNMSEDLKSVLKSPVISEDAKKEIATEVFAKDIHPEMLNFIKILIEKKRFNEFDEIKADFTNRLDKINNIQTVEIISAVELNEDYKSNITRKLGDKLQKNIRPLWYINQDIIAGLIFKIDDDVIDTSIKYKLDKLRKNLM